MILQSVIACPHWADFVAKVCGLGGSNFFRVVEAPFEKTCGGTLKGALRQPGTFLAAWQGPRTGLSRRAGSHVNFSTLQFFCFCNRIGPHATPPGWPGRGPLIGELRPLLPSARLRVDHLQGIGLARRSPLWGDRFQMIKTGEPQRAARG